MTLNVSELCKDTNYRAKTYAHTSYNKYFSYIHH